MGGARPLPPNPPAGVACWTAPASRGGGCRAIPVSEARRLLARGLPCEHQREPHRRGHPFRAGCVLGACQHAPLTGPEDIRARHGERARPGALVLATADFQFRTRAERLHVRSHMAGPPANRRLPARGVEPNGLTWPLAEARPGDAWRHPLLRSRLMKGRRSYFSIATTLGVAMTLGLLACHTGVGYMTSAQPCHAGGGCPIPQACVDGFCAVPEMYLGRHPERTPGYAASVGDGGGD